MANLTRNEKQGAVTSPAKPAPGAGGGEFILQGSSSRGGVWQFLRRGRVDLALLYGLVLLSKVGYEVLKRGGTYRFCELINRNQPEGRFLIGKWVDKSFLDGPGAVAMRGRFLLSTQLLKEELKERLAVQQTVSVMSIPSGSGRDVYKALEALSSEVPDVARRVQVLCMDIDPEALEAARQVFSGPPTFPIELVQGDALVRDHLPKRRFDIIFSMGFSCFMLGDELRQSYEHLLTLLEPGGSLLFNAMGLLDPVSRYFNQIGPIRVVYRTPERLQELLAGLPLKELKMIQEPSGLETLIRARI